MAWHPCRFWQCVENYGGQCFGGGCRLNPMPAPSEPENTQASDTEDKDNGRHTHETIADIIAEMRRGTRLPGFWRSCDVNEILQYHADRLEAAHRREVDKLNSAIQATVSHSDAEIDRLRREIAEPRRAGNAAKLREALVQAELFVGNIVRHGHQTLVPGDKCIACDGAEELRDMICAALAAPATTEKSSAIGDAAKLREALEKCANWGEQIDCQLGSSDETVYAFRDERCLAHNISECARAALAAPPRNCDVGTAEEQVARYHAFCAKMMKQNNHCCGPCPCYEFINGEAQSCTLLWAQMPYEEGGAK